MKNSHFPWYDSAWLRCYVATREYLRQCVPDRLGGFDAAVAPLRTPMEFQVSFVDRVFDDSVLEELRQISRSLQMADLEVHEIRSFGRWVAHNHAYLTDLQHRTTALVSRLAGEPVEPCYNFLSMYTKLGKCDVHMDAPDAKWTLDICIDQSQPWEIHFSQVVPWPEEGVEGHDWDQRIRTNPDLRFTTFALQPGNAILFSGSSQWHYRDPLPAHTADAFCDLAFFHYIPRGTSDIVNYRRWPVLFGLPDLERVLEEAAGVRTMRG